MRPMASVCGMVLAAVAIAACGGGSEEESLPEVDCSEPIPAFAEVSAFTTCVNCHSSTAVDREDAPEGVNFDSAGAARAHAEEAAEEVFSGAMPPSPYNLNEDEKHDLYLWALCGTPD